MEKEERLSKMQLKILTLLHSYANNISWETVMDENNEPTCWKYNHLLYTDLRKKLKIHKLTLTEICKKSEIPPNILPIKLMMMNIIQRDKFENQWDDDSLKASYSRSIKNLRKKGLISIGYTKTKPREKVIAFTQKGYDLICKKLKITQDISNTQEEQHGT